MYYPFPNQAVMTSRFLVRPIQGFRCSISFLVEQQQKKRLSIKFNQNIVFLE